MHLVCLDLEGVLLPECWIAVAERTGIPELRRTTREEPNYDLLMRSRIEILDRHGLTLPAIHEAIRDLEPLPGAVEFTAWLKATAPFIIISDTFQQFAAPLMAKLGSPTLFCHELIVDAGGRIVDYKLRQKDQKKKAVEALRSLNFNVIAAGDSYNDLSMLRAADSAVLFRPTEAFARENSDLPVARTHEELKAALLAKLGK
ncbi:MAG TPA: bifunctional phosphoserine phosphatase/homoserine phosphotransferase ThrH [Opitutales bacterium]|nr:bifunctional phosphoserine phosphatase/homoserine phosphotransferase ThrH [Opitutales bacterium]